MKLPESSYACNSNKTPPTAATVEKKGRKKRLLKEKSDLLPRKLVKMLQTRGHIATRYLFQIDFVEMYPRAQHH